MRNISIELTQKLFAAPNPSIGWLALNDWLQELGCSAFYFFYAIEGTIHSRCPDCYSVELCPDTTLEALNTVSENTLYSSISDEMPEKTLHFFSNLLKREAAKHGLSKWPEYTASTPMAAYAVPTTVGMAQSMMVITSHKGRGFVERLLNDDANGISAAMTYAQRWHIIHERQKVTPAD